MSGGYMYLRTEEKVNDHEWTSKSGKKFLKPMKCKLCILICDKCGKEFSRKGHDLSPKRRNNKYKHFCKDCFSPAECTRLGHEVKRQNSIERIGEKTIDCYGYVRVYVGQDHVGTGKHGNAVREHTLVMERHLGRLIEKSEVCHHIDGDKTNNKLSNLQLMTTAEHNACHAKNDRLVMELYKEGIVGYSRKDKRYFIK